MQAGSFVLKRETIVIAITVMAFVLVAGCLGPAVPTPEASQTPSPVPMSPIPTTVSPPHHYLPSYYNSLYMMQRNLPGNMILALPTYLPDGFFFYSGTSALRSGEKSPESEGYCIFTYQHGQEDWVTIREQPRGPATCPDKPLFEAAAVGSLLANKGATGEVNWGSSGWCLSLTGTLPQQELEKIAASVQLVPYREGVVPPYEYQPPAHPLVRAFAVNRSATANGETITIWSLECGPDACVVKIRLGADQTLPASPAPVVTTAPPGPDLHAEWRVDGGRPLLTMPGGGFMFNTTHVTWKIEPLPEGSRELSLNISRMRGVSGPWEITVPLDNATGTTGF